MGTKIFSAVGTAADQEAVRAAAPLAAPCTIVCGPFTVPVAVVASVPTLERESGEAAEVLRIFLDEDPWAGMGSVHPGGWMLIARTDDTIVVGQRAGPLGLHHVVELVRRDGRFDATTMGSWQLSSGHPHEVAEHTCEATTVDDIVHLRWESGRDLNGVSERVVTRVEVLETVDEVHVLLWSRPNPNLLPRSEPVICSVGTGGSSIVAVRLSGPLGQRALINDFRVPPEHVTVLSGGHR